jgi:hypothetical protein
MKKATPSLPASSRMQMPSGGGGAMASKIKETKGMKGKSSMAVKAGGVAKKMVKDAKGKSMAKKMY